MKLLIVGAGPTGLTLALAAGRRGIEVWLVERAEAPSRHSKALAVQARTLEVMQRLGTAGRMLEAGLRVQGATLHLRLGTVRVELDNPHPSLPTLLVLPQAETERILLEAGARPERGIELVGLDQDVALLVHPNGRTEQARADWIVGCDGAHSAVRQALGVRFEGSRYPDNLILADCSAAGLEPARLHAFADGDGVVLLVPLPGALWRAIRFLPPGVEAPEAPTLEPFARPGIKLADPVWYSRFKISRRQVDRVRHGRVLLAGDAAHIHSPAGGQGMNLGIQDAYSLAAALAAGEAAVDRWAAERHEVAARVLRATDRATRLVTAQGPLALALREAAPRALALVPALRRRFARALAGLDYPELPD